MSEGGVPSTYGEGQFRTQGKERLTFARKMGEREDKMRWLQANWRPGMGKITPFQRAAGARRVV